MIAAKHSITLSISALTILLLTGCGSANEETKTSSFNSSPTDYYSDITGSASPNAPSDWTGPQFLPTVDQSDPHKTPGVFVPVLENGYRDNYAAQTAYLHQTFLGQTATGLILESTGAFDTVSLPVIALNMTKYTVCVFTGMGANNHPNISVVGTFAPNQTFKIDQAGVHKIVIFFGNDQTSIGLDYSVANVGVTLVRTSFKETVTANPYGSYDYTALVLP